MIHSLKSKLEHHKFIRTYRWSSWSWNDFICVNTLSSDNFGKSGIEMCVTSTSHGIEYIKCSSHEASKTYDSIWSKISTRLMRSVRNKISSSGISLNLILSSFCHFLVQISEARYCNHIKRSSVLQISWTELAKKKNGRTMALINR